MPQVHLSARSCPHFLRIGIHSAGLDHDLLFLPIRQSNDSFLELVVAVFQQESADVRTLSLISAALPRLGRSRARSRLSWEQVAVEMSKIIGLWLLLVNVSLQQKDPLKDFCRRFGHQTAVIDRKLYLDGGLVNWNPISQNPSNYTSRSGRVQI